VISEGTVVGGTFVVSREELLKEGPDLAERAHMELVATPKARIGDQTEETSGLMIRAGAPVSGRDGTLLGVLHGAILLNRSYALVDKVKQTVYQDVTYKGKDIGTATIFQWDVRISTNVRTRNGDRAVATRLSDEVYREVLERGRPWVDRAFVVDDWYVTAYEPLRDIDSNVIGALYVGILEKRFTDLRKRAIGIVFGITLVGMTVALIVSAALAKGVLSPIRRLVLASREWGEGNFDHRVDARRTDEISQLASTFNVMAASLQDRDRHLKEYADEQIMKSEKLAVLGQLAAGVAHEINNPLGGALMYTHLALEKMVPDDPARANLEKAADELTRCRDIVQGLLDFSRQTEPRIEETDVNMTVERTLSLVEGQPSFHNVDVIKALSTILPNVPMDVSQMQQVFTNILLNAVEAMEEEGQLVVTTRMAEDNLHVEIVFTDSGRGIRTEDIDRIFQPFYTTKEVGRGTGLGLAVSHGIVTRHKGSIQVSSKPGRGTTVVVKLPVPIEGVS
jgi:two-component system NtrC family sensor kinase